MESINWHSFYFLLFALVTCLFAMAVVFTSNIVRMAFYLVISLGATAGLFFLAGADFVGAMQLMMYVGGTMVLLVFGVMLTASGPFVTMKTRGGEWILAIIVGGALLALLLQTAFCVDAWHGPTREEVAANKDFTEGSVTATKIGGALIGYRVDKIQRQKEETADPTLAKTSGGMSGYLMPFELVAIHLLVVLVGAAYLARPKRAASRATDGDSQ